MRKAHLAILPTPDGRSAERRIVNLAASLREPGASLAEAEVVDLSVTGFGAETDATLEPGAIVWLKLPGLEPTNCRVVWVDGRNAGFEFLCPLHPATLDTITAAGRTTTPIKRHFGAGAMRPSGGLRPR
ncbi:MAG TPA: PilZ domain-containing protein [Allosphingosinicella sp.]|nr:PilZ domain-containing protein [Allosphingosinicella sp.]